MMRLPIHPIMTIKFSMDCKGNMHDRMRNARPIKTAAEYDEHCMLKFSKMVGSANSAHTFVNRYNELNSGTKSQKLIADGKLAACITMGLSIRVLKSVFKIGSDRYYRLLNNRAPGKPGGNSSLHFTVDDIDRFKKTMRKCNRMDVP